MARILLPSSSGTSLPGAASTHAVKYVEDKPLDMSSVEHWLNISANANHWSNFGPVSQQLEQELAQQLELSKDLRVVVCCNATTAIHSLIAMYHSLAGKPLRWATSSFGFYSSADGILSEAKIIDCDDEGMFDIDQLDPSTIDGIIVTNIFGQADNIEKYRAYAHAHHKILVVDSAMAFHSGNRVPNECISLHHTKPWGFGEGGCAIVHKDHEELFRSMISFGHSDLNSNINRLAVNGKISDISSAFILMRLQQMQQLKSLYREQYDRIVKIGLECGLSVLADTMQHPGVPASVPLLLPKPLKEIEYYNFPIKRYYHPLAETPKARNIYDRIINIPCHADMAVYDDDAIKNVFLVLLSRC